jgi:hypothetical protein
MQDGSERKLFAHVPAGGHNRPAMGTIGTEDLDHRIFNWKPPRFILKGNHRMHAGS